MKKPRRRSPRPDTWRKNLISGKLLYQTNPATKMRLARVEKGISQAQVARRLGISPAAVGDIERAATPVKTERAGAIASMLGLKVDSLFAAHPKMRGKLLATR